MRITVPTGVGRAPRRALLNDHRVVLMEHAPGFEPNLRPLHPLAEQDDPTTCPSGATNLDFLVDQFHETIGIPGVERFVPGIDDGDRPD